MRSRSALLSGAASAALAVFASPAFALTADEVWQNQTGYLTSLGFVVEATPIRDGTTTVMSDVRTVWTVPMGLGTVTVNSPDVTMVENGDGSVAISYPDKFRISIAAELQIEGDRGTLTADFGVRLEGQSLTVTGTTESMAYASQTALMDVVLDRIRLFDEASATTDEPNGDMILTIRDLVSDTTIGNDGLAHRIQSANTTGQSLFEISFEGGWGTVSTTVGSVDTTSSDSALVIPVAPVDWLNLSPALREGLSVTVSTESANSRQQTVTLLDGQISSDQRQTVARSAQTLALSASGLSLGGTAEGLTFVIAEDFVMPAPIEVSAATAAGNLVIPVLSSPDPQPAAFSMDLTGLTASDDVWSLLDPGATLPREPASLAFGLDAEVINRVDVFDILGWEGVVNKIGAGQMPVDLVSLDITALDISAIGAALTGEGSFTFDNTDLTTFPGFPRPEGQATAQMTGIYAALDILSQMGLLPPEAGMGARAAIGMFAQATGDDQLTTTLAIGPDGAVTVNGMPIPTP
jgi:hypothetical protein